MHWGETIPVCRYKRPCEGCHPLPVGNIGAKQEVGSQWDQLICCHSCRHRERHRYTQRPTARQTDRLTEGQTDRQTLTDRQTGSHTASTHAGWPVCGGWSSPIALSVGVPTLNRGSCSSSHSWSPLTEAAILQCSRLTANTRASNAE